jgi:beta-phosphoglucomutase
VKWTNNFDLFLFDFDGLLVDTEPLHFKAYCNTLKNNGFDLDWTFEDFSLAALTSDVGLKATICSKIPLLKDEERWEIFYEEKKRCYLNLLKDFLKNKMVKLMPGVEKVLTELKKNDKRCCIVTNAELKQIELIKNKNPILKENISHWITREDYLNPKPDPGCYLKAIQLYSKKSDRIIGFEDSLKGIDALLKTRATCVLICSSNHPQMSRLIEKKVFHFDSFEKIPDNFSFIRYTDRD